MKAFLNRYQIAIYFVLTFILSWFPWYAGIEAGMWIVGPSVAAFIIVIALRGKDGLLDLLRSFVRWRAKASIWAVALLGPAILYLVGLGVFWVGGGQLPPFTMIKEEAHLLIPYLFLVVLLPVNGPVGEEFGWRGYALPKLQSDYGPLVASLVIGILWGVWHLPDFFADTGVQASLGLIFFVPYILGTLANSVYMTWLYNKSRASALIAGIVWHASGDFWAPILLSDGSLVAAREGTALPAISPTLYGIVLGVLVVGAIILIVLTKGSLGYAVTEVTLDVADVSPTRQAFS